MTLTPFFTSILDATKSLFHNMYILPKRNSIFREKKQAFISKLFSWVKPGQRNIEKTIHKDIPQNASSSKIDELTPDVYLDVPSLTVDELKVNADDLEAQVALRAELSDIVKINIGVNLGIKKIDLDLKGVNAQAVLKVRLKQVYNIFKHVLDVLDKNPDIFKNAHIEKNYLPEIKDKTISEKTHNPVAKNVHASQQQETKQLHNRPYSIDHDLHFGHNGIARGNVIIKKNSNKSDRSPLNNPKETVEAHNKVKRDLERHRLRLNM